MSSAVAYIAAHYKEPNVSVTDMAAAVGLSEGRLSHLFKQETGLPPNGYLTRYRIQKAAEYLKDCRMKVYEVCELVGYRDQAYFSSTFKKITGVSPSDYQTGKH